MSYEERAAALGIERGALAPGAQFKPEFGDNDAIGREKTYLKGSRSMKLTANSLGVADADFSHLNAPHFRAYQKSGSSGGQASVKEKKAKR